MNQSKTTLGGFEYSGTRIGPLGISLGKVAKKHRSSQIHPPLRHFLRFVLRGGFKDVEITIHQGQRCGFWFAIIGSKAAKRRILPRMETNCRVWYTTTGKTQYDWRFQVWGCKQQPWRFNCQPRAFQLDDPILRRHLLVIKRGKGKSHSTFWTILTWALWDMMSHNLQPSTVSTRVLRRDHWTPSSKKF